jgi:hypothetical protein
MLPDLNTFCVRLLITNGLCVTLPGGAKVCATFPNGKIPTADELTNSLLAQVNTALVPMLPIFNILDVLVAMVKCIKAVEKCLGPPPDPTELVKCFPQLAKAVAKVLKMLPQLSVPVLIAGILDVLIMYLMGVRGVVLAFLNKQLRILAAQTYVRDLGSIQLQTAIDCANEDLQAAMVNLNQNSSGIGQLVEVVNLLLGLAGLPELPLGMTELGADAKKALLPIDLAIQVLTTVRAGFP